MKTLVLSMISIAAILATMTACTSESDPVDEVKTDANVPVNFGQSIGIFSKAIVTGTKLSSTTIGIWGQEYTSNVAWGANNFMDNLSLSVDQGGAITYTTNNTKYYSIVPDTKYDFHAYSPIATADNGLSVNAATENSAPTIKVILSTTAGEQTDVMIATTTGITKSSNAVALTFTHALAQIKFQIKKATGVQAAKLSAIKVNANTTGVMSLSGTFSTTETKADFIILENGTTSITENYTDAGNPILLFPEETLDNNSVTFTIDGKDYSFTPTATLTAGKITTIKVEISASGVNFSQSVTDWSSETDGSGEIK